MGAPENSDPVSQNTAGYRQDHFSFALLLVAPLSLIMLSDSPRAELGGAYVILFLLLIAMVLMLISNLMTILIAMMEPRNKSNPQGQR
ncbi:hypothetical protein [Aeromonas molluscorum]|uniref:hypothetical protein n=1 Tax=Aeromonas molluscorum TaxID=271417 RepID=UPI001F166535|nr:hypothetical protein [Aeromonas molluscorum]